MDQNKIQTILDWLEPHKVKDVQSFLDFCNFYHCFIYGYSNSIIPLMWLTHKSSSWNFDKKCCAAFEKLKEEFMCAPILTHWVPDTQMIIETASDASDYALTAILSIHTPDGEIHPVAFHSHSFNPAELNYDTHDKELLKPSNTGGNTSKVVEPQLIWLLITKIWNTSPLLNFLLGGKPTGQNSFPNST